MIELKLESMPSEALLRDAMKNLPLSQEGEKDFQGTSSLRVHGNAKAIKEVALALFATVRGRLQQLNPACEEDHRISYIVNLNDDVLFFAVAVDSKWETCEYSVRNLIYEMYMIKLTLRKYVLLFTSHHESLKDLHAILYGK